MITKFQDGFITKSKLNELVDGINTFVSLTGSILFMATPIVPNGWLKADGSAVSRVTYSRLFTAIGTTYGSGDGSTTFNLPDLRGEFIRGWDDGRGVDSGRTLGSSQADDTKSHNHIATSTSAGAHTHNTFSALNAYGHGDMVTGVNSDGANESVYTGKYSGNTDTAGAHTHTITVNATGGTETRPRNIALMGIIKY
jgi:microcystin-dependent protein